jgi:hypothetical protein
VCHDVPLSLFGFFPVFPQPTHGGASAIEISILGVDFHAAELRLVIEPFATEAKTLYHALIIARIDYLSI